MVLGSVGPLVSRPVSMLMLGHPMLSEIHTVTFSELTSDHWRDFFYNSGFATCFMFNVSLGYSHRINFKKDSERISVMSRV